MTKRDTCRRLFRELWPSGVQISVAGEQAIIDLMVVAMVVADAERDGVSLPPATPNFAGG